MPPRLAEIAFETALESRLLASGYVHIAEKLFDHPLVGDDALFTIAG